MSDRDVCPFCGEGAYGNGHYKCDTWVVYGDNGLAFAPSGRSTPCYQTELTKLRAVAHTAAGMVQQLKGTAFLQREEDRVNLFWDFEQQCEDALEAAGYLQPLTPPSGEEN